jgi:catechol 2,3-dioxygenase-like lactoylglutathione lyase family enzyme
MSATEAHSPSRDASVGKVDFKLEVEIIPVPGVDRSKEFYERLGWRLDDDIAPLDGLRIVQFTPPGSGPRSRSARVSRRPPLARLRGADRL